MEANKKQKVFDIKKRSYLFALDIINLIRQLPKDLVSEIVSKQLLRSATSIGANVVEGHASSSKKDFINFHQYALKSANETKFWLCLLRDSISDKKINNILEEILEETKELSNILATIVISAKNKKF